MFLEKEYNDVLNYYPNQINISDGKLDNETGSFHSGYLTSYYDNAEELASLAGEWQSLINWVIYQVLHTHSKAKFKEKRYDIEKEINRPRFRELLIENLKTEGYEDMYNEFLQYEKENGTFC